MRLFLALCLCLGASWASPDAHAAKKKKKAKSSAFDEPAPKGKKQDVKFSGLKLKGDLKKPDLSYIYKRAGLKAEQIVNIPTDFNDEIQQGENQF